MSPRKSGQFNDLGLDQIIVRALDDEGYKNPTPVQSGAIPLLLQGRDVFGIAQTGSGKTCAFLTPVLQFLHQTRNKRKGRPKILSLILSPTRELAAQIDEVKFDHMPAMFLCTSNFLGRLPSILSRYYTFCRQ